MEWNCNIRQSILGIRVEWFVLVRGLKCLKVQYVVLSALNIGSNAIIGLQFIIGEFLT